MRQLFKIFIILGGMLTSSLTVFASQGPTQEIQIRKNLIRTQQKIYSRKAMPAEPKWQQSCKDSVKQMIRKAEQKF